MCLLCDPVKKRVWLKYKKPKTIAGLSALSQFSMLNPPSMPVFAISADEWKKLGIEELPSSEDAKLQLEIWKYDPNLVSKDDIVDPFSLYLSLKANEDERVQTALEEMMEKLNCKSLGLRHTALENIVEMLGEIYDVSLDAKVGK